MSHIDGTMVFDLGKPFEYSKNGTFEKAQFIELHEYSAAHSRPYMKLKQFVDRAIFDTQKFAKEMAKSGENDEKDGEISGSRVEKLHEQSKETHQKQADDLSELLNVAFSLSEDDERLFKFTDAFKAFLFKAPSHPIAMIDGDSKMLQEHWAMLSPEDQIDLSIRYCSFFGIGLLGAMKTESETASEPHTGVKAL